LRKKMAEKQVKKMDAAVMSWAKRFLLFFLLLVGIPAAGFAVYHTIQHGQEVEPITLESLTEKGAYVCHECGEAAIGYWYNVAHPKRARVYFCKRHQYYKHSEIEDALIPHRRLIFYALIGLVLVIGPLMLVKYRPRRLEIMPSSSPPSVGAPPVWFWMCVLFNTLLYPMAPVAFFIGLQGYRAYPPRSWRRIWGLITSIWSILMIVLIASLVTFYLKEAN